jgi:GNAT superfamily N-acetyltransferase
MGQLENNFAAAADSVGRTGNETIAAADRALGAARTSVRWNISSSARDFLPGRLRIVTGRAADYRTLARFHYLGEAPATWAGVWTARYLPPCGTAQPAAGRVVGVVVLSWPSALHAVRHRVFGLTALGFGQRLRWVNAHLRTISRVVVHPQFRSLGLASDLIRTAIAGCPTRYVETSARMAEAHPMFARCGMTRAVIDDDTTRPAYFHFDRANLLPSPGTPGEG